MPVLLSWIAPVMPPCRPPTTTAPPPPAASMPVPLPVVAVIDPVESTATPPVPSLAAEMPMELVPAVMFAALFTETLLTSPALCSAA